MPIPTSAKKRSPPSTSKPQPKQRNKQDTDSEDSEADSSSYEEAISDDDGKKRKTIGLRPELTLLKDILRSEIKSELDKLIDIKLEPLQTSLNSLVANWSLNYMPQPTPHLCEENISLKIQCLNAERENKALKLRVRQLEKKQSPPSTSKPQPKRRNKQDTDSEDSEAVSQREQPSI